MLWYKSNERDYEFSSRSLVSSRMLGVWFKGMFDNETDAYMLGLQAIRA